MSETDTARELLSPYCTSIEYDDDPGLGLDIGFGGSAITDKAITFDLDRPYTNVGGDKQIMKGNCRNLSMFCDNVMDYIHSSHLLEDFPYDELINIVKEWRRVLKPMGLLIINCPDQQKFLAHCARTGQSVNLAHYEQDFSLQSFNDRVIKFTGQWREIFVEPNHGPYSWLQVLKKL